MEDSKDIIIEDERIVIEDKRIIVKAGGATLITLAEDQLLDDQVGTVQGPRLPCSCQLHTLPRLRALQRIQPV